MTESPKAVKIYENPSVEEVEVSGTSPLLTGSTEPDSVYTDGGDAW